MTVPPAPKKYDPTLIGNGAPTAFVADTYPCPAKAQSFSSTTTTGIREGDSEEEQLMIQPLAEKPIVSLPPPPPPPRVVNREVCDHVQFLITEKQRRATTPTTMPGDGVDAVGGGREEMNQKKGNLNDNDNLTGADGAEDELASGKREREKLIRRPTGMTNFKRILIANNSIYQSRFYMFLLFVLLLFLSLNRRGAYFVFDILSSVSVSLAVQQANENRANGTFCGTGNSPVSSSWPLLGND